MKYQNLLFSFRRAIWQTVAIIVITSIVFIIYILSQKEFDDANELRIKSFYIANELRQSSDDLTRTVRTYVVTGNPSYKDKYQEILDIRDGIKPRSSSKKAMPLLRIVQEMNLTTEEFKKLEEAKKNSDTLTQIEHTAMKLIDTQALDQKEAQKKAINMLYDETYHKAKTSIMNPINEFNYMIETRMNNTVHQAKTLSLYLLLLLAIFGLFTFFMLWKIYKELKLLIGGDIEDVHKHIVHLGNEDFSLPIIVVPERKNSILGWLKQTQINLERLTIKNRRLKNLYAALSQCNQAIVRSKSQDELFDIVCRDAIIFGEMKMAWIGLVDKNMNILKPVASYGQGIDYLKEITISIDPSNPSSQGPSGLAVLNNKQFWSQDFANDPMTAKWHKKGKKYNWGSSAALPLEKGGKVVGVFNLYAEGVNAFDDEAKNLLTEMAMDISHALNGFEHEKIRQKAENNLTKAKNLLESILNTTPVRIFWKDKNLNYLGCNLAFAKDAGLNSPSDLIGKNDVELSWRDNKHLYSLSDKKVIETGASQLSYEEQEITPDGEDIWLRKSKVPLYDEHKQIMGILGVYEDITKSKLTEQKNLLLANYDTLTGLPNRTYLNTQFKYLLAMANRTNETLTVMLLDLDHFKDINDNLGHNIGDILLVESSKRLQSALREIDVVARLGGDEFIVLLPNITIEGAGHVAQKIIDIIQKPFIADTHELSITTSIGIALYPDDGLDFQTLYKNVDTAMYKAKKEGRNGYRFFTRNMQKHSMRNLKLSNAMFHALNKNEFELYYQPQISCKDGKIIGAEALLRWNYGKEGMISPMEFIPIAENNGLILPIGEWVIHEAIKQAKTWLNKGLNPIVIAINISAVQFRHSSLPKIISSLLQKEELPPEYIELELTESVTMHNPQKAVSIMNDLHNQGVRMSIDDFGTGYSSLSYLKKFKVYKLKIDKSFIRDINIDEEDKAIVDTIINMAKNLGLKTIAEGVETIEQLQYLQKQGCDEVQGYYYSKPICAKEFEKFLIENYSKSLI